MKRSILFLLAVLVTVMLFGSAQATPYTKKLDESVKIYHGPGYDYGCAGDIGEDGVYTIVEESVCKDGWLWGRLKSGAGWVALEKVALGGAYTINLAHWIPVYGGPGYDYCYNCVVGEDGIYTIVEETMDDEGNIWGKLKSGVGWVDLTYVKTMGNPVITATYADEALLDRGGYLLYKGNDIEYAEYIVFHAHESLADISFSRLGYDADGYYIAEKLIGFDGIDEELSFVAAVVFYGDMTSYGISLTDESGERHHFCVYISGRNGSLILEEYAPS